MRKILGVNDKKVEDEKKRICKMIDFKYLKVKQSTAGARKVSYKRA